MNSEIRTQLFDSISGVGVGNIYTVVLPIIRIDRLGYFDLFFSKCIKVCWGA